LPGGAGGRAVARYPRRAAGDPGRGDHSHHRDRVPGQPGARDRWGCPRRPRRRPDRPGYRRRRRQYPL
ncbi:MAG: hypothetical protein AVDCRST_MAG88-1700, partial [uncultured Thermomicrobiales bacterium]